MQELQNLLNQGITPQEIEQVFNEVFPEEAGIKKEDSGIIDYLGQIVYGWLEGFSTIPGIGSKPKNTTEAILRSIGHLGGFIGILFPGLGVGRLASRRLISLARFVEKSPLGIEKLGVLAEPLRQSAKAIAAFRSVPMLGADWITKNIMDTKLAEYLIKMSENKAKTEQLIHSAVHLGSASAISAWHEGLFNALQAGAWGAVYGGLFNYIGNLDFGTSNAALEKVLKGMAGSLAQGLPSTLQNAPAEIQIYDYLLGAYFGANTPDATTFKAANFVSKLGGPRELIQYSKIDPNGEISESVKNQLPYAEEYLDLEPEVKNKVQEMINELTKSNEIATALKEVLIRYAKYTGMSEEDLQSIIEKGIYPLQSYDIKPGSDVLYESKLTKVVKTERGKVYLEDMEEPVDIEKITPVDLTENEIQSLIDDIDALFIDYNITDDDFIRELEDFDAYSKTMSSPFKKFIYSVKKKNENITDVEVNTVSKKIQEYIVNDKNVENGFGDFLNYVETAIKENNPDAKLDEEGVNLLKQVYIQRKNSYVAKPLYFSEKSGNLIELKPPKNAKEGEEYVFDSDLNRISVRVAKTILHKLTNDDEVIRPIIYVAKDKKKGAYKTKTSWRFYNLTKDIASKMQEQLEQEGYYLYSGLNDKDQFIAIKYNLGNDYEAEFERIRNDFNEITDEAFDYYFNILTANSYFDEETTKKMFVSNVRYWEMLNGKTIREMYKASEEGEYRPKYKLTFLDTPIFEREDFLSSEPTSTMPQGEKSDSTPVSAQNKAKLEPKAKGKMTFAYGKNKRKEVKSSTTFEAIKNGERTATTRYASDGNIDYWRKLKVGDIVEWRDAKGNTVLVRITKPLTKLSPDTNAEEWSKKEGWSVEYFNKYVKPRLNEAYQMEFELVKEQPTQETSRTINVWSIEKNGYEILSNLSEEAPIEYESAVTPVKVKFKTLEGAFQAQKLRFSSQYENTKDKALIEKELMHASGKEAKALGRKIKMSKEDIKKWDAAKEEIMKDLLRQKFEQNPKAKEVLLSTGDAVLTHNQSKDEWRELFPKLLMEIREELKAKEQRITREYIQQNKDKVFVFGDNDLRKGFGGQAKEARGEENAIGIRTKKAPCNNPGCFYTDEEYEENIKKIDEDVEEIKKAIAEGKDVVFFPKIGEGFAKLKEKAPKTYEYLQKKLNEIKTQVAHAKRLREITITSGGAAGSDTLWHFIATELGIPEENIKHFRGPGVQNVASKELRAKGIKPTPVDEETMKEGYKEALISAANLGRRKPTNPRTLELLARNYAQIKDADVVVAVTDTPYSGGTAYAIDMALRHGKPVLFINKENGRGYFLNPEVAVNLKRPKTIALVGSRKDISPVAQETMGRVLRHFIDDTIRLEKTSDAQKKLLGDFIKNPIALNKRLQILFNKFYAADESMLNYMRNKYNLSDNDLSFVIIDDFYKYIKGSEKEETDGAVIGRDDLVNAIIDVYGLPKGGGFIKPFGVFKTDKGLILEKSAIHNAGEGTTEALRKANIGFLKFASAIKQSGEVPSYRIEYDPDKKEIKFYREIDGNKVYYKPEELERVYITPDSLSVSTGIFDKGKKAINQRNRLFLGFLNIISRNDIPEKYIKEYTDFLISLNKGQEIYNEKARKLLGDPESLSEEEIEKLAKHVDDTDVALVAKLIADPKNKVYREKSIKYIISKANDFDPETKDARIDIEEYFGDLWEDTLDGVSEFIHVIGNTDAAQSMKQMRKYLQGHLAKYFVKRLIYPEVGSSGKAIMRAYDMDLRNKIDLKENEFYLDDYWRKLKIKFINKQGEEKRMTLEQAFDLYKSMLKEEGYEEIKKKMEEMLTAAVSRAPIDDISGIAKLKFRGFTGRKGTGILLHPKTMRRLGGADLDIDSAKFFFDIPRRWLKAVGENNKPFYQTKFYRTLQKYVVDRGISPNEDPAELFVVNSDSDKKDAIKSLISMFDSATMIQTGHDVSKGRGVMMGVITKFRHFIQTAYSNADKNGIFVSRYYDSKGDPIPKMKVIFHARKDNGEAFKTVAAIGMNLAVDVANYGKMVSPQQMKAAILASAFDKIEVEFPNGEKETIYDVSEFSSLPEALENITKNLGLDRLSNFVGSTKRFEGMHPAEIRAFAKSSSVKIPKEVIEEAKRQYNEFMTNPNRINIKNTDIGKYMNVDTKLFRKDYATGRKFTRNEIVEAIAELPDNFFTPLRPILEVLYEVGPDPDTFSRIYRKGRRIAKIQKALSKEFKKLIDMRLISPEIAQKLEVPFTETFSIIRGVSRHYSPELTLQDDRYNLFYERGRINWSREEEKLTQYFIDAYLNNEFLRGEELEITPNDLRDINEVFYRALNVAITEAGKEKGSRNPFAAWAAFVEGMRELSDIKGRILFPKNEENIDRLRKKFLTKFVVDVVNSGGEQNPFRSQWRYKFITREIERVNDFVSNDLQIFTAWKIYKQLEQQSGVTDDMVVVDKNGEATNIKMFIKNAANAVKRMYISYWKAKRNPNLEQIDYNTILETEHDMRRAIAQMVKMYNEQVAKTGEGPLLEVKRVMDLYYAELLREYVSPEVTKFSEGKLRVNTLAFHILPRYMLLKFAKEYNKLYSIYTSEDTSIKKDVLPWIYEKMDKSSEVKLHKQVDYVKNILLPSKEDEVKVSREVKSLVDEIVKYWDSLGLFNKPTGAEDLWKFIRHTTGAAHPGDITVAQLEGVRNQLRRMLGGSSFFNLLKTDERLFDEAGKPVELKHKHFILFPETVADEWFRAHAVIYDNKVYGKDGKINPTADKLYTIAEDGRLKTVYGDTAIPMTYLHMLIAHANKANDLRLQANLTYVTPYLEGKFNDWIAGKYHFRDTEGELPAEDIFRIAIRLYEMDERERFYNSMPEGPKREKFGKKVKLYTARWVNSEEQKLLSKWMEREREYPDKKLFKIRVDEGYKTVSVSDVIKEAKQVIDDIVNYAADNLIYINDDFIKNYLVLQNTPDGVKIDLKSTLEKIYSLYRGNELRGVIPYEGASFIANEYIIDRNARKYAEQIESPKNIMDVINGTWEDGILYQHLEKLRSILPKDIYNAFYKEFTSFTRVSKESDLLKGRKSYLLGVLRGMQLDAEDAARTIRNMEYYTDKTGNLRKKRGLKLPAHLYRKGIVMGQTFKLLEDLDPAQKSAIIRSLKQIADYHEIKYPRRHVYTRLFGPTYSQILNDTRLAMGGISKEEWLRQNMRNNQRRFKHVGREIGYIPHLDFSFEAIRNHFLQKIDDFLNSQAPYLTEEEVNSALDNMLQQYYKMLRKNLLPEIDEISLAEENLTTRPRSVRELIDPNPVMTTSNLLSRIEDMDGYSLDIGIFDKYMRRINDATYGTLTSLMMEDVINQAVEKNVMGKYTKDWEFFMRAYKRQVLGLPSTLPEDALKGTNVEKWIKKNPWYILSDEAAFRAWHKFNKWIDENLAPTMKLDDVDLKILTAKLGHPPTEEEIKKAAREKWKRQRIAHSAQTEESLKEWFARKLKQFAILEGRYETATLLFHPKTGVANALFGNINTWVYNGYRHIKDAFNVKKWQALGVKVNGHEVRNIEDLYEWVTQLGVVEDFLLHEMQLKLETKYTTGKYKRFFNEVFEKIRSNPHLDDRELKDIAKKYNITEEFVDKTAYFMRKTERYNRVKSFLSTLLALRESIKPVDLKIDDPFLIEGAKKGVAMTQFLYDAPNKPLFASTSLGNIYSRFKTWAWSSVKFRRKVFEDAADKGFAPNTPEFERLQRLLIADLFVVGLALLLPYTIFDYSLPAPYSWLLSLSQWAFGDDGERERAFFISSYGLPVEVAPLSELMPPLARVPKGMYDGINLAFNALFGGEIDNLSTYTVYTLFPGGRLTRDIIRSIENLPFTGEYIVGLPFHKMQRVKKKIEKMGGGGSHYLLSLAPQL